MVSATPTLGFIGLGAMGGGMACHLAKSGYAITGYDIYPPSVQKLVAAGGKPATSPADAAAPADMLILMVVNDAQATAVLFEGDAPAAPALRQGAAIILCSTVPPAYLPVLREKLSAGINRPDIRLLDCPVSGGSIRAAAGTLSIFSSGAEPDLDAAAGVLETMAGPLYRIPGGIGKGQVAKMCHQHQAATNIIMASEGMALAAAAGLDTRAAYDALIASPGRSWMFENRGPHMLENDWATVHSAVTIILKDAGIVTGHARATGFPLVLENTAEQLYVAAVHAGYGKEDDAGLVRLFLPKELHDATGRLAGAAAAPVDLNAPGKEGVSIQTVIDVFAGVHLASARECMAFAAHVGMDLQLLTDIVVKGAGASAQFDAAVPRMLEKGEMRLKGVVDGWEGVRERLSQGLRKAEALGQPLPMAGAALQALVAEGL